MEQFFFSKSDKMLLKNCSFSYIQKNCTFCFQTNKELFFVVKYFMELFFLIYYFMELFFPVKYVMELFFPVKYFMELCDEVELVYQRLRVFSGEKKRKTMENLRPRKARSRNPIPDTPPLAAAFSNLRKTRSLW